MENQSARQPAPPNPEKRPFRLESHGDLRWDPWYWLRDAEDPEVLAHLRAENGYVEATGDHQLADEIYVEMVGRIQETDQSVPVRWGSFEYFHRTEEGKDYPIHSRRAVGSEGEEVLLDENIEAEGSSFFAATNVSVRPDHAVLAFAIDRTGDERYDLCFRRLSDPPTSGSRFDEVVTDTSYGLAWAATTVFYTRVDEAMRPHQVWRHQLGEDPTLDVLVMEEADGRFVLSVGNTKDHSLVLLVAESHTTSEVSVIPVDDPTLAPALVTPRRAGVEYSVELLDAETYLICTNTAAPDFRIAAAPIASPDAANWREVIPHRPGIRIEDAEVFPDGRLVVSERAEGEARLRVTGSGDDWFIPVEEHPSTTSLGWNPDLASTTVRYEQTSLATPRSEFAIDLDGRQPTLLKRAPVVGGFPPLRTERIWVDARDGTRVPMSLVRLVDSGDGPRPCVLSGYGAYEYSLDPRFSSLRLSLLERGFMLATAHVRGGGELGRPWYEDGKMANKPHSFSDFVDCARELVDSGRTSPPRLAIRGGSAGGLLVGAALNMAPELFQAVVAEVPFVDCLTTMLDDTLPLTIGEWEEWGNPVTDPEAYRTMKSYSPYDNVPEHLDTRVYASAGLHDPRVGFWEPAKWVARLREAGAQVTLRVEMEAGHAGPSGRYEAWREEARIAAFLLDALTQRAGG